MPEHGETYDFDMPYQNDKAMVQYFDHMPRPYYKLDWLELEEQYPTFFDWVESQKTRNKDARTNLNYIHIKRWLLHDIKMNKMYLQYYDSWYFVSWFLFQSRHSMYHYWMYSDAVEDLENLKNNLNMILANKPMTFNINDDYPEDNEEHVDALTHFMDLYYPSKSPLE